MNKSWNIIMFIWIPNILILNKVEYRIILFLKTGLSSRLRAQVPSATFVNYETFKISQMNLENSENGKQEDGSTCTEPNGKGSSLVDVWLRNYQNWNINITDIE